MLFFEKLLVWGLTLILVVCEKLIQFFSGFVSVIPEKSMKNGEVVRSGCGVFFSFLV